MFINLKALCITVGRKIYKYFVDNDILPQMVDILIDGLYAVVSIVKVPILLLVALTSGFSTAWIESIVIGGFLAVMVYILILLKLGMYISEVSGFMYLWMYLSIIAFIANTGMRQLYKNWRNTHERSTY